MLLVLVAIAIPSPESHHYANSVPPLEIEPITPSAELFNQWMLEMNLPPIMPHDSMSITFMKFLSALKRFSRNEIARRTADESMLRSHEKRIAMAADDYPYFGFLPLVKGKAKLDGPVVNWEGQCFSECSLSVASDGDGVTVTLITNKAKSLLCTETLLLGTVDKYSVQEILIHGTKKIAWNITGASAAVKADLATSGVRIFAFVNNIETTLNQILQTVELFEPDISKAVPEWAAEKNLEFLSKYRGINMAKRPITDVILNETDIHSGDFFGVMRLDGLDPMLAWAMGSTTGHTTVALWSNDGQLYVCESTATSSYWDVNGIQKTLYRDWIAKAKAASYNVVHLPLAPELRAVFNETAAWEFFRQAEGFDYGYNNMLWGWVDTAVQNYPCIPSDNTRCLNWDIIEVVFPIISSFVPKFLSFYDQAFNKRMGTEGLTFAELLQEAHSRGISPDSIPAMVEQDSWSYNTTRNGVPTVGPSMVCCVFVCHIWKAAGIFGNITDDINCEEFTNWDDSSTKLFDSNYQRPEACVEADPDNSVCQILGEYSLSIDKYNTKAPYAHMAENCPGLAPDYSRPDNC